MLMVNLLAGASAFLTFAAAPAPQEACAAPSSIVPVSITPTPKAVPDAQSQLPVVQPKNREPAVLLPDCNAPPQKKRRKRFKDYPMA
jgi:hypothetical protein